MNSVRKHVLFALAALSMGGAALAAQADTPAPTQGQHPHLTQEQRQAKMAEFKGKMDAQRAQHLQQLHDALKLSAAQEQGWNAFAASMKPAAHEQHADRAALANLPAPERMQKMIDFSKQRTAEMETHLAALNTFYSTLSADQKKVFDEQTRHFMGEHGMGGHGMHGQHRPGMQQG
jgi:uncharacterized glyoxalase superfamily metalloenzyme YdcJ